MAKKPDQYYQMTEIGRELYDYWKKFKPKMFREMEQTGTLWEILTSEDNRLSEMVIDLIHHGMSVDQAMDVARAEIYETEET